MTPKIGWTKEMQKQLQSYEFGLLKFHKNFDSNKKRLLKNY